MQNNNKISPEKYKQNWTRFPNVVLDNLHLLTASEFKVLGFMIRKNEGYEKANKQFAINYIVKKINMSNPTVQTAIKGLIDKKCINQINKKSNTFRYDVCWVEPENKKRIKNLYGSVQKIYTEPYKNFITVKDNIITDNNINIDNKDVLKKTSKDLKNPEFTSLLKKQNLKEKFTILKKEYEKFDFLQFWNSQKNDIVKTSRHSIPVHTPATPSVKVNKTVSESFKYIDMLLKGTFFKNVQIDPEFMEKHKIDETDFSNITKRTIYRAITTYAEYWKIGNWPQHKTGLPKSLDTFLFNSHNGHSFFILCLKLGTQSTRQALVNEMDVDIKVIQEFGSNIPKMANNDIKTIIYNILTWFNRLDDKYFEEGSLFYKHLGDFMQLRKEYQSYLSSRPDATMCVTTLSPGGKYFNYFKKDIIAGKFGIDI